MLSIGRNCRLLLALTSGGCGLTDEMARYGHHPTIQSSLPIGKSSCKTLPQPVTQPRVISSQSRSVSLQWFQAICFHEVNLGSRMIYLLDNYDSFTWNLVQRIGEIDGSLEIKVERNDQTSLDAIESLQPDRIIISPGPCTPAEAGLSRDVIRHFGPQRPVLGVCLGHQCLADVYGARVERAGRLMHGKTSQIHHEGDGVFTGLPRPFEATRYHSLIVPKDSVPDCLQVTAWVNEDEHGYEVMGLQHREYPVHGVQFHPESFLTGQGHDLLRNFLTV